MAEWVMGKEPMPISLIKKGLTGQVTVREYWGMPMPVIERLLSKRVNVGVGQPLAPRNCPAR